MVMRISVHVRREMTTSTSERVPIVSLTVLKVGNTCESWRERRTQNTKRKLLLQKQSAHFCGSKAQVRTIDRLLETEVRGCLQIHNWAVAVDPRVNNSAHVTHIMPHRFFVFSLFFFSERLFRALCCGGGRACVQLTRFFFVVVGAFVIGSLLSSFGGGRTCDRFTPFLSTVVDALVIGSLLSPLRLGVFVIDSLHECDHHHNHVHHLGSLHKHTHKSTQYQGRVRKG